MVPMIVVQKSRLQEVTELATLKILKDYYPIGNQSSCLV